jgi:murein L,D-transpeptidase YcbB/YkuD
MQRVTVFLLVFILATGSALGQSVSSQTLSDQVAQRLRNRIEAAGVPLKISVQGEPIHAQAMLPVFYERRTYRPAWTGNNGPLQHVEALVKAISEADREGLQPQDYHLAAIQSVFQEVHKNQARHNPLNPGRLADLELLLTDGFLVYAAHLLSGRINPETIDPEWFAKRREHDLAVILQAALDSNQIEKSLKSLLPQQPGYARLGRALARYREIEEKGGWPGVPEGPRMQKGDHGERVAALCIRLSATGDFNQGWDEDTGSFDDALELAVISFQQRHGLKTDGVVGRATLEALNVPVEQRIRQIVVNMERWRWLPEDLGRRHILVNIANFELDVVESEQVVQMMRVIVGRDYRRTPVFSDMMTYLVFSPYWNVPAKIAIQDIVPQVQKDVNYLFAQNIRVFQGWGAEAREIDPTTIDWSKVTAKSLNYRFRQEPGPANALGRVKFMLPNPFNVYLHDTPKQELFEKLERAFSSGCIRIEKPIELAQYVLKGDPRWTRENILAAIGKGIEQAVPLPEPIPTHLLYWTAWADEDGGAHFRNDLYGRDKRLDHALRQGPPAS